MQKAISFNDVSIVYVKGGAYRIIFWHMSKDAAINIMNNSNLIVKMGVLYFFYVTQLIIKTTETWYQIERWIILKMIKKKLRKQARDKCRN